MRLKPVHIAVVILIAGFALAPGVRAQRPDSMMPEASAAKGQQIVTDLINGLGGAGYTEVRESQCEGRRSQFGHNGEPLHPVLLPFSEYRRSPDKVRTEYIGKGHNTILPFLVGIDGLDWSHGGIIVTLYNGDHGWTLDRSGVTELPATAVSDFQEQIKRNVDNLLRLRLKEPGISIRFGGSDTVDLKPVDWVEITDSQERTFRLAVDRSRHLLVRSVVITKDEETQQFNEDAIIYSNYQLKDSVWAPLQISREHNGRRTAQFFYDTCRFNPGFPDSLFTKDSLSKHGSEEVIKRGKN